MYEQRWDHRLGQAKGRRKIPNQVNMESIARLWVTMIPNFKDKKKNSNRTSYLNHRR